MAKPRIRMENAPEWYDTPLDQLDFPWSREEKLEIERYCEKIHKNIAEEEMTPKQRWEATIAGKEKDRVLCTAIVQQVFSSRTLDSGADAIKPIDIYRNPKLLVKAHLATAARFKLDVIQPYSLGYTEDLWGAQSKLIEYGSPVMIGAPPVKTMEDLEGMEIPDPKKHGLYPGYLWGIREIKKILVEYDLDDKVELQVSTCPDSVAIAQLGMMSISGFMITHRKDPEVCKKAVELGDEFLMRYNQAVIDIGAHSMWTCYGIDWQPVKGYEWTLDHHLKVAKHTGSQIPTVITATVAAIMQWIPLVMEKGIMGPGAYAGWAAAPECDYKMMIDSARENGIFIETLFPDKVLLNGPVSAIEQEVKIRCDYGKSYPKFALCSPSIDYWAPIGHVDAAFAAVRKYGRH